MSIRWFRLDDYYETVGDKHIFYPHLYARGYRLSAEERAALDRVLGPFLNRRLRFEFAALFLLATFFLTIVAGGFLASASNEELDMVLATPPWVWLVGAVAFAGVILAPILIRLHSKIRHQLDGMGLEASEPPRPDFFIVDGEFSRRRLSYVLVALSVILALAASISQAGANPLGL